MLDITLVQPRSLKELWSCVTGKNGIPRADRRSARRFLAGGTDLMVMAKHGVGVPAVWIDLSQISELARIEARKDRLFIGARATLSQIEESEEVRKWAPALAAVCPEFASPPIRALATLGGNCVNASPAGDAIPALYACGAVLVLARGEKTREVPVEKFFLGVRKTVLRPDELVTGIKIPKRPGHRGVFLKAGPRKGLAIAKASLSICAAVRDHSLENVRIGLGAVAPTVLRVTKAERILEGGPVTRDRIEEAAAAAREAASPITDHRSTAEYRRAMSGVLLRRAVERLLA